MGRALIGVGLGLVLLGLVVLGLERFGLGRLPGDIAWRSRSGSTQVFLPLGTCLLLSVLLSVGLAILARLRR